MIRNNGRFWFVVHFLMDAYWNIHFIAGHLLIIDLVYMFFRIFVGQIVAIFSLFISALIVIFIHLETKRQIKEDKNK